MAVEPPCGNTWATIADLLSDRCPDDSCGDLAISDPYVVQQALDDASFMLNAWTAFQYQGGQDGCEKTVRPVPSYGPARSVPEWTARAGGYGWGMFPTNWGASYLGPTSGMLDTNFCCYGSTQPLARRGGCCNGPSQIDLGAYPVNSVTEIMLNGLVVPPDEYRIDDDRWLVRLPAPGETDRPHWPACQRVDLPDTEDLTFSVTFNYGGLVPEAGVRAAIALGCAIAAERCGGPCLLPVNTSSVAKQGVTVQLVRPTEDILDAMPAAVRTFVNASNPNGIRRRPRVFSSDLPRQVVTTTWP